MMLDFSFHFTDVYNTLTIHGILSMDELPDSVLKVRQFWKNTCYRIADHIFSLDDIEHGILRGESTEKVGSIHVLPQEKN